MILTVVFSYLLMPNITCGKLSCHLIQLGVLFPFWKGHFFIAQISLIRKISIFATTNQTGKSEKRHKILTRFLTILFGGYFAFIQFINGPDGIVYQVSKSK